MVVENYDTFSWGDLWKSIISLFILFFPILLSKLDFQYFVDLSRLSWLNINTYPYFNPPIFFSIGEALAAVAILLAVYQFKKEKWDVALEIKSSIKPIVIFSISFGFVAIILSSIFSFWKPSSILFLSVFWQIISSISITFAIVFLFLQATNKGLFSQKTKDRFVGSLLRRVLSRSPKQIDLVVGAIGANFEVILREISVVPQRGGSISRFAKAAHFVIDQIVSNPNFTHHVVTTRADFLQMFLQSIKEKRLYNNYSISIAFNAFVKALFLNRDSYFYNELKHSDPGVYYRPFLEDIFFDQDMFLELRPFDQISFGYGELVEEDKLSLFLAALETAIKGYFKKPQSIDFEYSHYKLTLEQVGHVFSRVIDELKNNNSKNDWPITNKVHQITFFAGWRFLDLYKEALKNNTISQHDLDVPIEEKSYGIYPHSLTSGYIELIFKLLCGLSDYPDKESARHYAMTLADDILTSNEPQLENMRKVLLKLIWNQIRDGGSANIKGFYPLILPVFLSLIGMWQDGSSPEEKAIYNQTVEFLNNELKPKILAGTKMANNEDLMEKELLSPYVVYNREKGLFEYRLRNGIQEMIIRS